MTEWILGFSPETFARRRQQARASLDEAVLVLPAAPTRHRSRDTEYRYRPDSELFYLTGCTEPGVVAVFGPGLAGGEGGGTGDPFTLFVPERDPRAERWSGPRMGPEEARERFGAGASFPRREMEARLPELLRDPRKIFFRPGIHPELDRMVLEAMRGARTRGPRKGTGPRALVDPGEILDPLRLRKDPQEVATIRRATQLTVAAFRETLSRVHEGMGEWEVESLLEGAFRRGGGTAPAFPTIVGSGSNACVLHYGANQDPIPRGSMVLLDGGAEVDLYAGDVTRTFPVSGSFQGPQAEIYALVLEAQKAAMAQLRPGGPVDGIHDAATRVLTRGLVELGILEGDEDTLLREKACEPYFPHQTSHWLGLDVHDVGDYARAGEPALLEVGMVLTVEPGLYFSPSRDEVPEAFRGLGIRIEDDLLVTEAGAENLTAEVPTSPELLAALVGSDS